MAIVSPPFVISARTLEVPFFTHNATRAGIWFLILLLPLQGLGIEIRACAGSVACTSGKADHCGCCCSAKRKQERSCCCHASTCCRSTAESQSPCCQHSAAADSSCQCGIGCPCGNAPSSNPPAIPTRDSDSRASNASLVLTLHAFDSALDVKSPQQRIHLQLETIQSLTVDRCSTLCRFTL